MPWSKETTDSHKSSNPKPKTTKPISATNPDTMLDSVDACWPSFPFSSYQYTNSELSFHRTSSQQAVALRFSGERHSPQSFVGRRAQSNTVRLAPRPAAKVTGESCFPVMSGTILPKPFDGSEHRSFVWTEGDHAALLIHGFPGTPAEMLPLGTVLREHRLDRARNDLPR